MIDGPPDRGGHAFRPPGLSRKTNPIAQCRSSRRLSRRLQIKERRFSTTLVLCPAHSSSNPSGANGEPTWATAKELPIGNQPSRFAMKIRHHAKDFKWPRRQRNLALAAVSTTLILIWIAYIGGRPVSPLRSSTRPTSTVVDQQLRSKVADSQPAKTAAAVQPAPVSVKAARPPRLTVRRVRIGSNEVDYVGEDVTVRYFTYPSAQPSRPTADRRVAYIGDDVTVRYFTPQPAVRPDGR